MLLELITTNFLLTSKGHVNGVGTKVLTNDGILEGDGVISLGDLMNTSVGLSLLSPPPPVSVGPFFRPNSTPKMTANATMGAVIRIARVDRLLNRPPRSVDLAVASSFFAIAAALC